VTIIVAPPIVTTEGASLFVRLGVIVDVGEGGEVDEVLELEPSTFATLFFMPVNPTDHVFAPPPVAQG